MKCSVFIAVLLIDVGCSLRLNRESGSWLLGSGSWELTLPVKEHYEMAEIMSLDGCTSLFLDVGANAGLNLRQVFEPEKYPMAFKYDTDGINGMAGNMSALLGEPSERSKPFTESGVCAIAFEANPQFKARHDAITVAYKAKGWKVQYITPAVVLDRDGEVTFHLEAGAKTATGSSVADRNTVPNGNMHKKKFVDQALPSFNFARFIEEKVMPLRAKGLKNVLMKMDIESAEYVVLPEMAKSSTLCAGEGIDLAIVEYHNWAPEEASFKEQGPLEAHLAEALQKCKKPTVFVELQKEAYGKTDPAPLP